MHRKKSPEEVGRLGDELYDQEVRESVETPQNVGKLVSIDIASGDFEVAADVLTATSRLRMRHPNAEIWTRRIGYDAVFAVGGTTPRTSR